MYYCLSSSCVKSSSFILDLENDVDSLSKSLAQLFQLSQTNLGLNADFIKPFVVSASSERYPLLISASVVLLVSLRHLNVKVEYAPGIWQAIINYGITRRFKCYCCSRLFCTWENIPNYSSIRCVEAFHYNSPACSLTRVHVHLIYDLHSSLSYTSSIFQ